MTSYSAIHADALSRYSITREDEKNPFVDKRDYIIRIDEETAIVTFIALRSEQRELVLEFMKFLKRFEEP